DSAATSVKVGYRQASYIEKPHQVILVGFFAFGADILRWRSACTSDSPTVIERVGGKAANAALF
ncbi:hypothetical protein ABIB38_004738, partial [Massilia sp. UYP11]|uniref:hypothetical protein n=1 Tax=Massilia sp. UYP11 TaxID=1756385 RepID=UPI003D1FF78E